MRGKELRACDELGRSAKVQIERKGRGIGEESLCREMRHMCEVRYTSIREETYDSASASY